MSGADERLFGALVEHPVLPIRVGAQWYAVTLEELDRLCGMRELAAAPLPLAALPGQTGGALAVILRGAAGPFALLADEAESMLSVPPEQRLPLPELLRGPENAFLQGAFYWAARGILCFLLRCGQLEPQEDMP